MFTGSIYNSDFCNFCPDLSALCKCMRINCETFDVQSIFTGVYPVCTPQKKFREAKLGKGGCHILNLFARFYIYLPYSVYHVLFIMNLLSKPVYTDSAPIYSQTGHRHSLGIFCYNHFV